MPKVTLYVKDSDNPIWERARKLAKDADSLSSVVTEALSEYVDREERRREADNALRGQMETMTIDVGGERPHKVRFTGALLVEADGGQTVYVSRAGKLIVEADNSFGETSVHVFDDFDEFREKYTSNLGVEDMTEIAEALGREYFEEID